VLLDVPVVMGLQSEYWGLLLAEELLSAVRRDVRGGDDGAVRLQDAAVAAAPVSVVEERTARLGYSEVKERSAAPAARARA
jgi:hypothetical protein